MSVWEIRFQGIVEGFGADVHERHQSFPPG